MSTSRRENRVLETYARSLIEAAKAEGRVFQDRRALDAIAGASPEVLAILTTMFERGQLDLLPEVAETYRTMCEADDDVVGVTVTTAVPLDDDLREQIQKRYEADFGCSVFLISEGLVRVVLDHVIGTHCFEFEGVTHINVEVVICIAK